MSSEILDRVPFQPIGEVARWRKIYSILEGLAVGETMTYDSLGEFLELDPENDRNTIQKAMQRATKELLREHGRTVDAVSGMGYRVVAPIEHLRLAARHQKRAVRQVGRARDTVHYVDRNGLAPVERDRFEHADRALSAQQDMIRRTDIRRRRLDKVAEALLSPKERAASEVEALRTRLERLEGKE